MRRRDPWAWPAAAAPASTAAWHESCCSAARTLRGRCQHGSELAGDGGGQPRCRRGCRGRALVVGNPACRRSAAALAWQRGREAAARSQLLRARLRWRDGRAGVARPERGQLLPSPSTPPLSQGTSYGHVLIFDRRVDTQDDTLAARACGDGASLELSSSSIASSLSSTLTSSFIAGRRPAASATDVAAADAGRRYRCRRRRCILVGHASGMLVLGTWRRQRSSRSARSCTRRRSRTSGTCNTTRPSAITPR